MHRKQEQFGSVLIIVFIFLLVSCGGEDSGNREREAGLTSAAALKSAFNGFDIALSSDAESPPEKASFGKVALSDLNDPEKLLYLFELFNDSFNTRRTKGLEAVTVGQAGCPLGGTRIVTLNDQGTVEKTDDSFTFTDENCAGTEDGKTFFLDGTFFFEPLPNGYRKVYINYRARVTESSGRTTELLNNGIIKVTGNAVPCGDKLIVETATLSINLTGAGRLEETGDGTLERNESFAMEHFTMVASGQYSAAPDCLPTATTFTLSGGMSSTDHLNSENNFSSTFRDLEMTITRVRSVEGAGRTGSGMRLSGAIEVDSRCTVGAFTLSTPADAPLFFPRGQSCAIEGRILITEDNATTAVIATEGGGIQVDNGNDGIIEEVFPDCKEAKTCA